MATGLAVMRMQPLHRGHEMVLRRMLAECETAIVGLGSVQESGTEKNPLDYKARRLLLERVFPGETRLRTLPLRDIGAPTKKAWADYVLEEIRKAGLPAPDRYYAGSEEDASWFESTGMEFLLTDREGEGMGISATEIRRRLRNREPVAGLVPPVLETLLREMIGEGKA